MRPTDRRAPLVGVAVTLTLAMAVGTFVQFALGILGPTLAADFALSRTALGSLTTCLFVVAVVCTPPAGLLVDRWGARRSLGLLFVSVAAGLALLGAARSYGWLLAGAALSGLALSIANPGTNRLLASNVSEGRRGAILGIKQSGVPAGAMLAGVLLPFSAAALGWRGTLLAAAALPVVGLAGALRVLPPDPPAGTPADTPAGAFSLLLRGRLGWLAACAFFIGAGMAPVTAYLPLYVHEDLGFTLFAAGLVGGTVGCAGVAGRLVWGWLAEREGVPGWTLLAPGAGATAAAAGVALATVQAPPLVWVGAGVLGLTGGSWMVVGMLAAMGAGGPSRVGRSTATVALAFHAGFVPSPALFGRIVDQAGSYRPAWLLVAAAFACATLAATRIAGAPPAGVSRRG